MLEIQQQFISYNKSARSSAPIYIVVHDTGNPNSTAQNNHDYFAGGNRNASADYFVDSNNIIQIIDTDNYYSWQVGDGGGAYGITNRNSVGIEMCIDSEGNPTEETVNNTIDLVKYLMNKYGIGINNVVRHYDASRKCCPCCFSNNNWARWYDFKDRIVNGSSVSGEWIFSSDKNKWWYKHSDGTYTQDGWEKINNKWYLFDQSGWMLYDWKSDEGKWYYLGNSNDGSMKIGWQLINSKWYYFDETGAMIIGWKKINGYWYFFNTDGSMITGWFKDKGYDYLTYSTGELIVGCDLYGWHFDNDGHATKLGK